MDYIRQLGALSLASRIRRLVDTMTRDGTRVYRDLGIDFEVRWFAVFHLLSEAESMAVMEIAEQLGQAHPTVIQMADEMTRRGLVKSQRDRADGRRRLLALTARGRKLAGTLRPVWSAFDEAGAEIVTENGNDFLRSLETLETAIERMSAYERIMARLNKPTKE